MNGASVPGAGSGFGRILVLSLCFGMVGLDRFVINPVFPVIARDLGLGYGDIGLISAALALTWGGAAIGTGRLADRFGVRAVLILAMLVFSALAGLTGLAAGLGSLILIRALLGAAEGTFMPAGIVAATRASAPGRIGVNIGLLHLCMGLFGLALAPVLATRLLDVLPSWRWIFVIAALPGPLLAFALSRLLKADRPVPHPMAAGPGAWGAVLRLRNVRASAMAMGCWLAGVTTMGAFLPSYLTDHLHLPLDQMGIVLSGQGLGGLLGMTLVPALGDRLGHRRVLVAATCVKVLLLALFMVVPGDVPMLFALLLVIGMAGAGATALTVGPLTAAAVPPALATTATGLVVGVGEIVGGALAPALAGALAAAVGIAIVPRFAIAASLLGLAALLLAPRGSDHG